MMARKNPGQTNAAPQEAPLAACPIRLGEAVRIWIDDGKAQGFSPRTLSDRQGAFKRLEWWLVHAEKVEPDLVALTPDRIRRFLGYCREACPTGRFGCSNPTSQRPARPATVHSYYRDLHAFCRFCLAEALLAVDPM